jgi:hypothetical protein
MILKAYVCDTGLANQLARLDMGALILKTLEKTSLKITMQ